MSTLQLSIIGTVIIVGFYLIFKVKYSKKKILCGKTALVTGGSNGLGQQICIKLAQQGCNVIIADISSASKTMLKLQPYKIKSREYKIDVSNYEEILKMREILSDEFEFIDILVNNAGLIPYKTIFEQTSDEIETLTKVNLNSVIFMTKCFIEKMIKNGTGHIVTISSTQGIYAFPYSLNYCASKFAVTGFMLGLKEFLRRQQLKGIDTTCILPNVISTRKDIIDIVNEKRTLIFSADKCAETIIKAIINRQSFVTIPMYYGLIISVFNILPFSIQHFIRDFIMREDLFLKK
ncbi:hypothetical protein ACKWTF_012447 [Chironomus riparius]